MSQSFCQLDGLHASRKCGFDIEIGKRRGSLKIYVKSHVVFGEVREVKFARNVENCEISFLLRMKLGIERQLVFFSIAELEGILGPDDQFNALLLNMSFGCKCDQGRREGDIVVQSQTITASDLFQGALKGDGFLSEVFNFEIGGHSSIFLNSDQSTSFQWIFAIGDNVELGNNLHDVTFPLHGNGGRG